MIIMSLLHNIYLVGLGEGGVQVGGVHGLKAHVLGDAA